MDDPTIRKPRGVSLHPEQLIAAPPTLMTVLLNLRTLFLDLRSILHRKRTSTNISASRATTGALAFQGVEQAWFQGRETWTKIAIPEFLRNDLTSYCFHPAVADACGHGLAATTAFQHDAEDKGAFVGEGLERVTFFGLTYRRYRVCALKFETDR